MGVLVECDMRPVPQGGEKGPVVWTAEVAWPELTEIQKAHLIIHLSAILREAGEVEQMTMMQAAVQIGASAGQ